MSTSPCRRAWGGLDAAWLSSASACRDTWSETPLEDPSERWQVGFDPRVPFSSGPQGLPIKRHCSSSLAFYTDLDLSPSFLPWTRRSLFWSRWTCPAQCSGGRRPLIAGCLSLHWLAMDLPLTRPVWDSNPRPPASGPILLPTEL